MNPQENDSGNVSIDSLMDTTARVFLNVALLGMLFSLMLGVYGSMVDDVDTIMIAGHTRTAGIADIIHNFQIV